MWSLFAYMDDDEAGATDERRRLAEWQLQDALRWCVTRGYDHVYLRRDPVEKSHFRRGGSVPVSHHMHLVEEPRGEFSGDAA